MLFRVTGTTCTLCKPNKAATAYTMPGKMAARVSCGRDFHCCPDINTALDAACKAG